MTTAQHSSFLSTQVSGYKSPSGTTPDILGKENTDNTVVVHALVRSKSMTEPLRSSSATGTRNSITPTPTIGATAAATATAAVAAKPPTVPEKDKPTTTRTRSSTGSEHERNNTGAGAGAGTNGGMTTGAATTTTPTTTSTTTTSTTTAVGQVSDMNELLGRIEDILVDPTGIIIVNVPADVVGRMIGKHGTVIKELQLQSGASINIAKDGEKYRVAQLTGSPAEIRLSACLLVQKFTPAENTTKHKILDRLITHYRAISNHPQRAFVVESVIVPSEAMSRIIGKGGATLRDLQDQSMAKIDLPRSTGMDEPKKVLTISGSASEVASCRHMLHQVINQPGYHFMDESDMYYQGNMPGYEYMQQPGYYPGYGYMPPQFQYPPQQLGGYMDPYYMMPYGGGGGPGPNSAGAPPTSQMGYYAQPSPDQLAASMSRVSLLDSSMDSDGSMMSGHSHALLPHPLSPHLPSHQQHQQHQQHHQPLASPQMHASLPMPPPSMGPSLSPRLSHPPPPPLSSRPMAELIVCIPGDMVGRLIGRQGASVKQLQTDTHCRIDVLDPIANVPNPVRYVRVTASKMENVRMCEAQIHARVSFLRAHPGEVQP